MLASLSSKEQLRHSLRRGDRGATALPQWSDRWTNWGQEAREMHIGSAAHWPHLSVGQAKELIQHLPPSPHGYLATSYSLEEFAAACDRLDHDVARGLIPKAMTPSEFLIWCTANRIDLPYAFEVECGRAVGNPMTARSPTSPAAVVTTQWAAPLAAMQSAVVTKSKGPGRPASRTKDHQACIEAAREMFLNEARRGQVLTVSHVAKRMEKSPDGAGMTAKNIERRLKGQLPFEQARHIAARSRGQRAMSGWHHFGPL